MSTLSISMGQKDGLFEDFLLSAPECLYASHSEAKPHIDFVREEDRHTQFT